MLLPVCMALSSFPAGLKKDGGPEGPGNETSNIERLFPEKR